MRYRGRDELIKEILLAIRSNSNITLTGIMFKVQISYTQIKTYLTELDTNGITFTEINKKTGSKIVHMTDKGYRLLRLMLDRDELLKIDLTVKPVIMT